MIIHGKDDNEVLSCKELNGINERDMPLNISFDIDKRMEILESAMQDLIISTIKEGE